MRCFHNLISLSNIKTYSNYGFSVICSEPKRVYLIFIAVKLFIMNQHNMDLVTLQVKRCCQ